jgi:hypothetical protein
MRSVVYRVIAIGPVQYAYPLAVLLTIRNFGGLVPISLEFHPNTVKTAFSSLYWYGNVMDANTRKIKGARQELQARISAKV